MGNPDLKDERVIVKWQLVVPEKSGSNAGQERGAWGMDGRLCQEG